MRSFLLVLVGLLLGANLTYFAMHRGSGRAPEASPHVSHAPVAPADDAVPVPPREATAQPPAEEPADLSVPAPPAGQAGAPTAAATPTPDLATPAPSAGQAPAGLRIPVQGVVARALANTYDDARGEGRRHDAIDIMAPRGTPVVAVADGTVEKLFDSDRGGLTVYQFEPSGRYAYYYAHLDRYATGLQEGQPLRQGEVIGYVGSTGNAAEDAPHLHFAIFRLGPERHWWEGDPINPYPLLAGEQGPPMRPMTGRAIGN
ncbi:M23 family metallopeptidase [Marilutibacter spongiae]|uniref:Peptidoglycan DD-metalloendopeptidase family protein n=1 Tax=Marilutibacter spongiae TaxID=2025720 RepID=A0A7W3TNJ1_9GAMM|nr:M23 family metallopeptidase [Lysobacter spongiae]MBB1061598.1 peptidoglycan DD-metalloendopeptidase family protein [Lysobacter spongiae]